MCGIAGISHAEGVEIDATAIARLLVAGLAERGQDATGYAYHRPDGTVAIEKDSVRLADFIERVEVPAEARSAILHVRDFTKGRPGLNDNNHPIRYGRVVGVHNGHIDNDDELFAEFHRKRSTPHISVDSEAIMMLVDALGDVGEALQLVRGSAAIAVLRDGEPDRLTIAKRASRTLWFGRGDGATLFASTREPLELAQKAAHLDLRLEELHDGTALEIRDGEVASRLRFKVDRHVGRRVVHYPADPREARARAARARSVRLGETGGYAAALTRPCSAAMQTACVMLRAPILRMIRLRCVLTVSAPLLRCRAVSGTVSPRAAAWSTVSSVCVRPNGSETSPS